MIHMALLQVGQTPFEFASSHIHMLGWGTVVVAAWKTASFFTEAKQRVLKTENQIEQMATNHFPHMEKALKTIDLNIARMTGHMTGDSYHTEQD